MAKNFVQDGNCITMIAPSGGVTSSIAVLIGATFGVALVDAAENEEFELGVVGVWEISKVAADTATAGDQAFYNTTSKLISSDPTGAVAVGVFIADATNGATTATVRLDGKAAV